MSNNGTPAERLDALLGGLEEEVLRSEGAGTTSVEAMRFSMEALIETELRASERRVGSPQKVDAKGKVATAMERLGRWAGMVQGAARSARPRVRMAFSGEREPSEGGRRRDVGRAGRSPKGEKHDKGR